MDTLTVRPAKPADIPRLADLWYEKTVALQPVGSRTINTPDLKARWETVAATWLTDQDRAVFVVEHGAIVGYIAVRITPAPNGGAPERVGTVDEFVIDTHGYVPGAGRCLFRAACDWLRAQRIDYVVVPVARRSAVEEAFWRSLGAKDRQGWLWMTL